MTFHWHPEVVLGLEGLLAAYALAVGPLRRRFAWGPPATRGQVTAFASGTGILGLALLGPLAEWAEHIALSAHMAQHFLLLTVVPILWLLGIPAWLHRPVARRAWLDRPGYVLTRPVVALGLASAVLTVWHLPRPFTAALDVPWAHGLEHVSFLATSVLFWWPVAGPWPAWPRPSPPTRLLYLFVATVPMMAIAAPITLAEDLLYPSYAQPSAPWPLGPRADQEAAGLLMWIGGMLAYLVAGSVVFFRWVGHETEDESPPLRLEATPRGT